MYLYVRDKDGNLLSAAEVQKILQDQYSAEANRLFSEYDVVRDGTNASVCGVHLYFSSTRISPVILF